jgi:hypothetical protein
MKKLLISLIALGALSGVAMADSDSEYDREGIDQNFGRNIVNGYIGDQGSNTVSSPLAVEDGSGLTSFQKTIMSGKGDGGDR